MCLDFLGKRIYATHNKSYEQAVSLLVRLSVIAGNLQALVIVHKILDLSSEYCALVSIKCFA